MSNIFLSDESLKKTRKAFANVSHQRQFEQFGFEVVALFSSSDLETLRASYDRLVGGFDQGFHATMYSTSPDYRRAVYDCIRPIVERRLVGVMDGYRVCVANWVVKEAGSTDSSVGFHQDWSFVDESRQRSVNLWFPLIDVDEFNGCLEVVPGSHRFSADHRAHADDCRFRDLTTRLRSGFIRSCPMKQGEGLLYDGALLHSSQHNRSPHRRVAVGVVLIPADAQILHSYRISSASVEVYAVDDSFFWRHTPGTRPQGAPLIGTFSSSTAQYSAEWLEKLTPAAVGYSTNE
jgi:hypothetical protein